MEDQEPQKECPFKPGQIVPGIKSSQELIALVDQYNIPLAAQIDGHIVSVSPEPHMADMPEHEEDA